MLDKCIEIKDRRKIFTAKEEGKVYTLNNKPKYEIAKIKIDGCVFKDKVKKCDWLFTIETGKAIFVELKGSDVRSGLKQMAITYKNLQKVIGTKEIWFRLCVGEKNSVPKSVRGDSNYKFLFGLSSDNLKIGKNLTDTLS
jgi:hypothetical protein